MCYVSFYTLFSRQQERWGRGLVMVVTEWEGERKGEKKFVLVRYSCTACMVFHVISCRKKLPIRGVQ